VAGTATIGSAVQGVTAVFRVAKPVVQQDRTLLKSNEKNTVEWTLIEAPL